MNPHPRKGKKNHTHKEYKNWLRDAIQIYEKQEQTTSKTRVLQNIKQIRALFNERESTVINNAKN